MGNPELYVTEQAVKTGATRGDLVSILSGLSAGDEVVSSGVFKLRDGSIVQVNNTVQPGSDENPKPPDS